MAVYDPQKVSLIWDTIDISGFAEGSMIQVNMLGDGASSKTGTGGFTSFVYSADRRAEIMFRLMEDAPSNFKLQSAYDPSVGGNAPKAVTVARVGSGIKMHAGEGVLERVPGVTYDNGVPVREWKLMVDALETSFPA